MKYFVLVLFLLSSSLAADLLAQGKRKSVPSKPGGSALIDTMTIGGIRPGDLMAAFSRASFTMDTVFWQGREGANMFKGLFTQFGHKGECRISTREGEIQQVAFNMVFADTLRAQQAFDALDRWITQRYGDPVETYTNVHYIYKWAGEKRVLALKTQQGASTVSISLTQIAKPAASSPKLPRTQGK
jgi:hypothetical protein